MAHRSSWYLMQRLNIHTMPAKIGIRPTQPWSALKSKPSLFSTCTRHHSSLQSSRFSLTSDKPWSSRTSWSSKKSFISMQSCFFSTSRSSNDVSEEPDQEGSNKLIKDKSVKKNLLHENIYTIPNFLTFTRLASAPVIGYWVLQGNYTDASILFGIACVTDGLDGWIARRFNMQSIVGTIIDPMADKTLMTILTVTLAMQSLIPIPIAGIILGRDAGLILASFYYRYISLPEPKTFKRYWDFSIPSAEVRPTMISKVNTAIQMGYICLSLLAPVFGFTGHVGLDYLGYTCAATTIWSGASYVYTKDAVRILHPPSNIKK
ncbi:MAG: CDP-alcohol phosphatidyltransferase-domain-containing protein [Podila humilis]|nr:MAG: CDP-alcohol phosphatidyltransferase-domain-containing protein [Podila humilis]